MLDVEATRRNFNEWVRSPAFDATFNAVAKAPKWPFIVGALLLPSGIGTLPGIFLLIYGFRALSTRKAARRDAHLAFAGHQPVLCGIVIANRQLFRQPGAIAPALLVGGFGPQDDAQAAAIADVAIALGDLYGSEPTDVSPEFRQACAAVNDDTFQPNRRRPVPPPLNTGNHTLFDAVLQGNYFDAKSIDSPFVVCMVAPGPDGTLIQIPAHLAVFTTPP